MTDIGRDVVIRPVSVFGSAFPATRADVEKTNARLDEIAATLEEIHARVKKGNSLLGMLAGRSMPPKKKAKP